MQLESYISSLPRFPIYWKLVAKDKSASCRRLEGYKKNRTWRILFPLDGRKILNLRVREGEEGGETLGPCCEQAVLEEEVSRWRQWKAKEELQRGFGIGSCISKCSSAPWCELWFPVLVPHSWSWEGHQGHLQLQEGLAWLPAGK